MHNGNLLVPVEGEDPGGQVAEIGPVADAQGRWLPFAKDGEGTGGRQRASWPQRRLRSVVASDVSAIPPAVSACGPRLLKGRFPIYLMIRNYKKAVMQRFPK